MFNEKEYMGIGDWVWWLGVVEDTFDPMEIGRIKVRVFGYYNDDPEALPTKDLPWCYQVMPTTSASHDTHGASPTGLNVGSWVVGWFMDGRKGQFPICFGTIHGIHDTGLAFGGGGGGFGGFPSPGGGSGGSGGSGGVQPGSGGAKPPATIPGGAKPGYSYTPAQIDAMIEQSFSARGVDPNLGKQLYRKEGLADYQSLARARYGREQSFGPFQLHDPPSGYGYGGGLGTEAIKAGIDIRDPSTVPQQIDFTANYIATNGLNGQWSGGRGFDQRRPSGAKVLPIGSTQTAQAAGGDFNTPTPPSLDTPTEETIPASYDQNETACSADSVPKRAHSLPYSTYTNCDQDKPLSNQSNDKVDELDKTEGQYQTLWHDSEHYYQMPDPKDVGWYPQSQVFSSPGGTYIWGTDDTPGAYRIWEVMPENGTRRQWDSKGNMENVTTGSAVNYTFGNQYEATYGNRSFVAKNANFRTDEEISMRGGQGISIHNDGEGGLVISTPGAITFNAGQAINFNGSAVNMMAVDGAINMRSGEEMNMESKNGMNFNAGPGTDPGMEGGFAFDGAGPTTFAGTVFCCSMESAVKFESPDVNVKGGNMKVDSLSVDETFSTILNWEKTVSSSKYSRYADDSLRAMSAPDGPGGSAEQSNWKSGEYDKQTPLLSSGTFNSPPKGDPAYPGEKRSGPKGTSMVTRFKEFKDLITQGGKVRGGQRDLGSGGRGVAGHAPIGAAPKKPTRQALGVETPGSTTENYAPRTSDAINSEPGVG